MCQAKYYIICKIKVFLTLTVRYNHKCNLKNQGRRVTTAQLIILQPNTQNRPLCSPVSEGILMCIMIRIGYLIATRIENMDHISP